jgi:hypothetical protein
MNTLTPEMLKYIIGPTRRLLKEKEKNDMLLLTHLIEPTLSFNNQRTSTDRYMIGDKIYELTYGLEDDVVIEELIY